MQLREDDGQPGSYSGREVGFEEIAIILPQAHFWMTSCSPTIRLKVLLERSGFGLRLCFEKLNLIRSAA